MKKRILSILLVTCLSLSLFGCKNNKTNTNNENINDTPTILGMPSVTDLLKANNEMICNDIENTINGASYSGIFTIESGILDIDGSVLVNVDNKNNKKLGLLYTLSVAGQKANGGVKEYYDNKEKRLYKSSINEGIESDWTFEEIDLYKDNEVVDTINPEEIKKVISELEKNPDILKDFNINISEESDYYVLKTNINQYNFTSNDAINSKLEEFDTIYEEYKDLPGEIGIIVYFDKTNYHFHKLVVTVNKDMLDFISDKVNTLVGFTDDYKYEFKKCYFEITRSDYKETIEIPEDIKKTAKLEETFNWE